MFEELVCCLDVFGVINFFFRIIAMVNAMASQVLAMPSINKYGMEIMATNLKLVSMKNGAYATEVPFSNGTIWRVQAIRVRVMAIQVQTR